MRKIQVRSNEDYCDTVLWLLDQGCEPSLYKRGPELYRFHVHRAGNFWDDAETKCEACENAVNSWIEAGMPKEGTNA